jgi:hypothetical protein
MSDGGRIYIGKAVLPVEREVPIQYIPSLNTYQGAWYSMS